MSITNFLLYLIAATAKAIWRKPVFVRLEHGFGDFDTLRGGWQ